MTRPTFQTTSQVAGLFRVVMASALAMTLAACSGSTPPAGQISTTETVFASGETAPAAAQARDPLWTPPDGTLRYTVVLEGRLHKTGPHPGEKRDAVVRRKFEVTTRMHAVLGNGSLAVTNPDRPKAKPAERPDTVLDDLARQGEACNGDAACMMKISMKLMADKQARKEIEETGRRAIAMIGRVAVYSQRAPCDGRAGIDDSDDRATWWEDIGEGYHKTGLDQRKTIAHADATFDCRPHLFSDDPEVARQLIADGTLLYLDKQTGEYDLTIPPQSVDASISIDGKPRAARKVGTPKIALTALHGTAAGQPISGSKSLDIKQEDGVPLRAEVTWSFTPDRS